MLLAFEAKAGTVGDIAPEQAINVSVRLVEQTLHIDASFHVEATPEEAWEVMTAFDSIGSFVRGIRTSKVLSTAGNRLVVEQTGGASSGGVISYTYHSVREVHLFPHREIRSRLIAGTFKRLDGNTVLTPKGTGTLVQNFGVSTPDVWVPPVIGVLFVESETRAQFEQMRDEILRRRAAKVRTMGSTAR